MTTKRKPTHYSDQQNILWVSAWQIGCAMSQNGNLSGPPTTQGSAAESGWLERLQLLWFSHSVQRLSPTTPALPCPKSSLAGSALPTPPPWEAACWPTSVNPDMTSAAPTSSPASGTSPGAAAPRRVLKVGGLAKCTNVLCSGLAFLAAFRLPTDSRVRIFSQSRLKPVVSFVVWRVTTHMTSDFCKTD